MLLEMARKKNPFVFLDVSIGDDHAGKMVLRYVFPLKRVSDGLPFGNFQNFIQVHINT